MTLTDKDFRHGVKRYRRGAPLQWSERNRRLA